MRSIWPLLLLFMIGCSSVGDLNVPNAGVFYKRDLEMEINGLDIDGVYVAPYAKKYEIEGKSKHTIELLKIFSCHREYTAEKVGRSFEYDFYPRELELDGPCSLEIAGFDENGQHTWAFIEFYRGEKLQATIDCNGYTMRKTGVSICQAREGLRQRIKFDEAVKMKMASSSTCQTPFTEDGGITWQYTISPKRCLYVYYKDRSNIHRHITLGYEDILLRKI